jgi:hypothetical protein
MQCINEYINVRIISEKKQLEEWINYEIRQILSRSVLQLDGYHFSFMWDEKDNLEILSEKRIRIQSGILITQPAGLFSVEAFGRLKVDFDFSFRLGQNLQFLPEISIFNHEWIDAPKVRLGKLLIPVECISNFIISRMEDDIRSYLIQKISSSFSLQDLLGIVQNRYGKNFLLNEEYKVYLNSEVHSVHVAPLFIDNENIGIDLKIGAEMTVSDRKLVTKSLAAPATLMESPGLHQLPVHVDLKWDNLSELLIHAFSTMNYGGKTIQFHSLKINYDDRLHIRAVIQSPVEMSLHVELDIRFNKASGVLELKSYHLDLRPSNLIYRLATPVIKSAVAKEIEAIFPLDLLDLLTKKLEGILPEDLNTPFGKTKNRYRGLSTDDCVMTDQGMTLELQILQPNIIIIPDLKAIKY